MPAGFEVETPYAVVLLGATPQSPYCPPTRHHRVDHPSPRNMYSQDFKTTRLVNVMLYVEGIRTSEHVCVFKQVMTRVRRRPPL